MPRGVATGEAGENYIITDQALLDELIQAVIGHEIGCGVNHLLAAAGIAFEAAAQRGMPRLDALLLASFFRHAAMKAERVARACPEPDGAPPRAAA